MPLPDEPVAVKVATAEFFNTIHPERTLVVDRSDVGFGWKAEVNPAFASGPYALAPIQTSRRRSPASSTQTSARAQSHPRQAHQPIRG